MAKQNLNERNEQKRQQSERKRQKRLKAATSKSPTQAPDTTARTRPSIQERGVRGWFLGHAKSFVIWASVFASIAGGYTVIRAKVTIEAEFLENEREPFSGYFRVKNDGYFSIHDLSFSCAFTGGPFINTESGGNHGQEPEKALGPGESATKNCSIRGLRINGPAALVFSARFRPKFWPWGETKRERFAATQDARGVFHWIHQPLSK
jgi:hypothetical protein